MQKENGSGTRTFREIANIWISHFKRLYHEHEKLNMAEIIKVNSLFSIFVEETKSLVGEVSMAESRVILASLQKDNSPSLNGWTIEFFIGFMTY